MKDSEDSNKFVKQPYHDNPEYLEFLENCHSICSQIYIYRNIIPDEAKIIEQLKRIDGFNNYECFRDEE